MAKNIIRWTKWDGKEQKDSSRKKKCELNKKWFAKQEEIQLELDWMGWNKKREAMSIFLVSKCSSGCTLDYLKQICVKSVLSGYVSKLKDLWQQRDFWQTILSMWMVEKLMNNRILALKRYNYALSITPKQIWFWLDLELILLIGQ